MKKAYKGQLALRVMELERALEALKAQTPAAWRVHKPDGDDILVPHASVVSMLEYEVKEGRLSSGEATVGNVQALYRVAKITPLYDNDQGALRA